jgi:hypothetical protein
MDIWASFPKIKIQKPKVLERPHFVFKARPCKREHALHSRAWFGFINAVGAIKIREELWKVVL